MLILQGKNTLYFCLEVSARINVLVTVVKRKEDSMTSPTIQKTLTKEAFEDALDMMQTHHVGAIRGESPQPLPRSLSTYLVGQYDKEESSNNFKKIVKEETSSDLIVWTEEGRLDVSSLAEKKIDGGMPDDEWSKELDNRKNKDVEYATRKINEVYEKVKKRGNNHPEEREQLIKFVDIISTSIKRVVDIIVNFLEDLAKKIWEWLKAAYEYIKEIFETAHKAVIDLFT